MVHYETIEENIYRKHTENKYVANTIFSGVEVTKEIVQEQKPIPQNQGFPCICGIFLFLYFCEFLTVSNKVVTK